MRHVILVFVVVLGGVACKSKPVTVGAGSAPTPNPPDAASTTDAAPIIPPPGTDQSVDGCTSAHDCKLRDVCGCSCEGVLLSVPSIVDCDKSCPERNKICDRYTLICDLPSHKCGAIPRTP